MELLDKSGANTAALTILNVDNPAEEMITIGQNKYLNNLGEQEHRNIKRRTRLMLGFKSFRRAQGADDIGCLKNRQRGFLRVISVNATEPII